MNEKLVQQSIKLLRSFVGSSNVELAYSGGKDSDVILQLSREAGINVEPIYRVTTLDPPGTLRHVKENNVKFVYPMRSFFEIVESKGYPSRFRRFCCSELKEYKILDKVIMGIRKDESRSRSKNYNDYSQCRFYGKEHVEALYPILDWTLQDVEDFINSRKLKLAPIYYNEDGSLDCSRRLGCMCCPLASFKKRIIEFRKYPAMVSAYLKFGHKFLISHPNSKSAQNYPSIYHYFIRDVLCHDTEDWFDFLTELSFHSAKEIIHSYFPNSKID